MLILFFITVIDVMGFGMIFPLFPLIKVRFGFSNMEIGYVASLFAIAGIFGSILWGMLSDKFGRKYALALPTLCLAVIYYFTGHVENSNVFLVLRFFAGFFASNFSVTFAAASDLSTPETKFKNMGIIGGSFGLGFVFGPAIGGILAGNNLDINSVNFSLPFEVSAIISVIIGLTTLLFFKESLNKNLITDNNAPRESILKATLSTFSNKYLLFFLVLNVIFTSMMGGAQVFLGVWLNQALHFTPRDIGLYWSSCGLLMSLVQFNISKLFKTKQALVTGFILYGASMFVLAYTYNLPVLIAATGIMTIGIALVSPSVNTRISMSDPHRQGLIFGFNQAIASAGRIIGPNSLALVFSFSHKIAWLSVSVLSLTACLAILWFVKKD
ncbi:Tetracycline resistance protein, class B [Candidatus Hepatincola sp. Av]